MSKNMLIDAVHPEEIRVAVVNDGRIEEFDFESAQKKQLRGNIYLAKVTRVEPSLQAAFVEYGGNRHGFLAFNEIHPDYYSLPHEDREALLKEEAKASAEAGDADDPDDVDEDDETPTRRAPPQRRYKIQEVIRRRQVMLVQVVKEERGNKGAALTTYLSLAGRYCVLMPNTARGGGISRKITNASDRRRLKKIVAELDVPDGMGLIVRTAGAKRTKTEIKRDFEYLTRLWDKIKELTFQSMAPALINEEGGLVHRAMRDMYDRDIENVYVDGEAAYREAKDLAKMLMPSHARKVQLNKSGTPLFVDHKIESQLDKIFSPTVQLKSGGYLVIHQTEALVAIDVNSGKSTRERNIENTALRTNLEAAEEACRQMRMRDLAGLIVIDFIDMEENKNNRAVERKLKEALKLDRARVQCGKISMFGLMEISRQRRRAGVLDSSSDPCSACGGMGHVRSVVSSALQVLRAIEVQASDPEIAAIHAEAGTDIVLYLLNEKRTTLSALETETNTVVRLRAVEDLMRGDYRIETVKGDGSVSAATPEDDVNVAPEPATSQDEESDEESGSRSSGRRRRRGRRRKSSDAETTSDALEIIETSDDDTARIADGSDDTSNETDDSSEEPRRRRRRGRRGGRRRRSSEGETSTPTPDVVLAEVSDDAPVDGGAVLDGVSLTSGDMVDADLVPEIPAEERQATSDAPVEVADPTPSVAEDDVPVPAPEVSEPTVPAAAEQVEPTASIELPVDASFVEEPIDEAPAQIGANDPEGPATDSPVSDVPDEGEPAAESAEDRPPAKEDVETIRVVSTEITPENEAIETIEEKPKERKRRGWWQRGLRAG